MITVIKDNQIKQQTKCESCGSILEYSKEDIQWEYHHGGNGWDYHYEYYDFFIIFPVCHRKTKVRIKSLT